MAQGRSTKIISIVKWIRTSRLSIKNSLSQPGADTAPGVAWDRGGARGVGCGPGGKGLGVWGKGCVIRGWGLGTEDQRVRVGVECTRQGSESRVYHDST